MKKLTICFLAGLFVNMAVFAQSSDKMTAIIKSKTLTCGQASYLPALYTNLISEDDSHSVGDLGLNDTQNNSAFEALKANGYFSSDAKADSEITLAQISSIYMKALQLKGGLFYTITKSKRYAFKELKAKGILPTEADPSMKLSGREAIDIFNSCLELAGGNE